MTSRRLCNSLSAVLAFSVAATLIVGSAFAADGKFKRRGDGGKFNSGTFQIVVPKADRGGSKGNVAKFVAPKADRGGRQVAKFVAPKADRGNFSGTKTLFSLPPKAPRAGSTTAKFVAPKAPRGGDGPAAVKFVAPKAPRGDGPVVAAAEQPKLAAPQLLAPPSAPTPVKVEQAISAPAPIETNAPVAPVATEASDREVELAYTRAAQRYGYGDYEAGYETYDRGYDDTYTGGSYGDDGCY
jgi:hypothetical protein